MPWIAGIFDAFVNPWLLSGLALLSAPIIIHLLNRRHYTVVPWAAMDFLLQADSRNRRRLRLEDLILLLLRMALIGLIVFAVARPLIRGIGATREDERIIVLDDSFSLDANDGTGTAFLRAKSAAVSEVEDAVGRGIPVSVWSGTQPDLGSIDVVAPRAENSGSSGETAPGSPPPQDSSAQDAPNSSSAASQSSGVEAAARLLGSLRARETTDLPLELGAIMTLLAERLESRKGALRSVCLVSDFRAADWLEGGGSLLRGALGAGFADLKRRGLLEDIRWKFVDVGNPARENVAVTGVRLSTDHPLAKVPVRVIVDVKNFGAEERRRITGELEVLELVQGAERAPATAEPGHRVEDSRLKVLHRVPLPTLDVLPGGKEAAIEVDFTFEAAGTYPLRAKLESDRLPRDDDSIAVARVRDGLRVLVVDGDPGQGRFTGDSGFLLSAVAPKGTLPSGILPRRWVGELSAKELRDIDVVMILNRESLGAGERGALEDFVRRGGGLAFFLGTRVRPDSYQGFPLFPARLQGLKDATPRAHLRIGEAPHAAFDVFRGIEGSSLEQVGFDRYFLLEPAEGAVVAARYDDSAGTAAVLDLSSAKGKTALFNLTADRDWSDWPTDPSYPVVLQEWVRYLAPKRSAAAVSTVGEALLWDPAAGVGYSVAPPSGSPVEVEPSQDASRSAPACVFSATRTAGFYAVLPRLKVPGSEVDPTALEARVHAVRRNARDSDLEPVGEARLRSALAGTGVEFTLGKDSTPDAFTKTEQGETWRGLAYAAAGVLLLELALAWWFGRR